MRRRLLRVMEMMAPRTDAPVFTRAQCEALFAAILVNDVVAIDARLPTSRHAAPDSALLGAVYGLSLQLWREGAERTRLIGIADHLCRTGTLDAAGQVAFKHIRAKFKHVRACHAICDAGHRYPPRFHCLTAAMGRLQDAFKSGRRWATMRHALAVRVLLTGPMYGAAVREIVAFEPSSAAAFAAYLAREVESLRATLAQSTVTGHGFHAARKVVSRQAALYCALGVLVPTPEHAMLLRCLATLNGLMGRFHDGLVAKHLAAEQDYRADRFPLPPDIAARLAALVDWFST